MRPDYFLGTKSHRLLAESLIKAGKTPYKLALEKLIAPRMFWTLKSEQTPKSITLTIKPTPSPTILWPIAHQY